MKTLYSFIFLSIFCNFYCVGNKDKGPKNFYGQKKVNNAKKTGKQFFIEQKNGQKIKTQLKKNKNSIKKK